MVALRRGARQELAVPVLLLSPALLFVVAFIPYPLALETWFSLSNAQLGEPGTFISLADFGYLIRQSTFLEPVVNTAVYTVVGIAPNAVLGMPPAFARSPP